MRQVLRDYQEAAIQEARALLLAGILRFIIFASTGSGKTTIAAAIIEKVAAKGGAVLFLAHRRELINQCSARLDGCGIDHGIIQADHWRVNPSAPVQVASVQTLSRREKPRATLIVIDECHRARAKTYHDILEAYPGVPVIGLTATPIRADGKPLGELFEALVPVSSTAELIERGFLVPFNGFGFENPDLSDVRTVGGDYNEAQLAEKVGTTRIIGGIVERWLEHAGGVRTVAFAVNVEHSRQIVARFCQAGVAAEHLDGTTPADERDAILARLKSGETRVVSNVNVLTEGWDCPETECCILARPTKSLSMYLQQVGRVLRPAPGKTRALIFDHAGCLLYHGLPDEERVWSLDSDVKRSVRSKTRQCGQCLLIFETGDRACPSCGWTPPRMAREAGPLGEFELEEIDGDPIAIDDIRRLRNASIEEKAAEYKRLQAVAQRKGYKPGWVFHQYRATFGVAPRIPNSVLERVAPAQRPLVPLERLQKITAARGQA